VAGAAGFLNFLADISCTALWIVFRQRGNRCDRQAQLDRPIRRRRRFASGDLHIANHAPPKGPLPVTRMAAHYASWGGNLNTLPLTLIANSRFKTTGGFTRARPLGTYVFPDEGTAIYTMEILAQHGPCLSGPTTPFRWSQSTRPAPGESAQERHPWMPRLQLVPLNFSSRRGFKVSGNRGNAERVISRILPLFQFSSMAAGRRPITTALVDVLASD